MGNPKFGVLCFSSDVGRLSIDQVGGDIKSSITELGADWLDDKNISFERPLFFFILTGGTENKFLNFWQNSKTLLYKLPIILIAHSSHNSLPAALEILARLNQENVKGKIIFIDTENSKKWVDDLRKIIKQHDIYFQLTNTQIGLIGAPSDWLIASMPDPEIVKKVWGCEIKNIDLNELKNLIDNITDEEIEDPLYSLTKKAKSIKEPSKKEIKEVVKVYSALKKIIDKYKSNALSVRCFDLVIDLKTTGCFALSKLNDDGITAGCEGDIVSTIGMIWANLFTEEVVWMANPSSLDEQNNSLWLAHCTVPISLVDNYQLRSHFESGLGVGIEGEISNGKVTLLRIGGKNLEQIWISNGEIVESGNSEVLCRTQVKVKLHGSAKVSDLLRNPLGNHILMVRGSYAKELLEWWEIFINNS
jgi:L-fucose isomerase-like protein